MVISMYQVIAVLCCTAVVAHMLFANFGWQICGLSLCLITCVHRYFCVRRARACVYVCMCVCVCVCVCVCE